MKIYNTLSRELEEFVPLEQGHVRMYTCGPTVYDYAHIGNYRAYVFEDLLRRYLKYQGFQVTQVMNLTDVDDKTIRGSGKAGVELDDYTRMFKDAFFDDLRILNIEPAEHYPAATEHIQDMVDLIRRLFDAGYAYKSSDGAVYFSVSKFAGYGKLAHLDLSGLRAGARVAHDEYDKENVGDFALWKAWDENDRNVAWESPWGRGRPGWHIECSAMSMKYLGESFDIHTGGVDNIFPHHENEIAQSESATGRPFCRYWIHCEHLIVDGRKMAKSLGNFHTLRDILARGYTGREIRYVLASAQYRQPLNFSFSVLDGARSSLARLDEFQERLAGLAECAGSRASPAECPEWAERGLQAFGDALEDDLNTAEALAALFGIVHAGNKAIDANDLSPAQADAVRSLLADADRVLGFIVGASEAGPGSDIMALVERREQERAAKNWKGADRIRDEIARLGWIVQDTADGPKARRNTRQDR